MNKQSIEFGKSKEDAELPDVVRKSFRVPVEDVQKVWAMIRNKKHAVLDVCFDGVRIAIENKAAFTIDEALSDCELKLFNVSIEGLNGKVVHISSADKKEWQCGIHWIDMQEDKARQILEIVSKMKKQLLKDDVISFDSP